MDLTAALTAAQERAVIAPAPLVVEGLPGCGRTTALVARATRLLQSGTAPGRLLYLARQSAEARRVRTLIATGVGRSVAEPVVTTPTGLAAAVLRQEAAVPPGILSAAEARAQVAETLSAEATLDGDGLWPGFPRRWRDGPGFADALADICGEAQRRCLSPSDLESDLRRAGHHDWVPAAHFLGRYLRRLSDAGMVDPAGLVGLLLGSGLSLAGRYDALLVDDTEAAVPSIDGLLRALDPPGRATAVAWCEVLSGPASPHAVRERLAVAGGAVVELEGVRRGGPGVAAAVGALASGAKAEAAGGFDVHVCAHPREEAEAVASVLAEEARAGAPYDAMAVFGRADSLDAVERTLCRLGIPCRRSGGERLDEHWALKPMLKDLEQEETGESPDARCYRLWIESPEMVEARTLALAGDQAAQSTLDAALALVSFAQDFSARRPTASARDVLLAIRAEDGPAVGAPPRAGVSLLAAREAASREFDVVAVVGATDSAYPGGRGGLGLFDPRVLDGAGQVAAARAEVAIGRVRLLRAVSRARRRVVVTASVDIRGRARLTRFVVPPPGTTRPPALPVLRGLARAVATEPATSNAQRLGAALWLARDGADPSRWWGVREWTTGAPIPVGPLSYSAVARYDTCPLAWLFDKRLGFDEARTHYTAYGTLVHELLTDLANGVFTEDQLLAEFERRFEPAQFPARPVAEQYRREGRRALAALLEWPEWRRHRVVATEAEFEVEVAGVKVNGRIDRVDEVAPGKLRVVDYKTGRKPSDDALDELLDQLRLYLLAVGRDPRLHELGEPVAASLWYLDPVSPKPVHETLPETAVERVEARVAAVVAGVAAARFAPTPTPEACRRCGYHHLCPTRPQGAELLA